MKIWLKGEPMATSLLDPILHQLFFFFALESGLQQQKLSKNINVKKMEEGHNSVCVKGFSNFEVH